MWKNPESLEEIEAALDEGRLYTLVAEGKWWRIRRNGLTRRWKRDLDRFYIPWKAGMNTYGSIVRDTNRLTLRVADFRWQAEEKDEPEQRHPRSYGGV